jgi:hypothetical protein
MIQDPALRRRMGEAGQARARKQFDWSVIFQRYRSLWDDLGERRRSGARAFDSPRRGSRPDRPDPFTLFSTYPTGALAPTTLIQRREGATADLAARRRDLGTVGFAQVFLPSQELIAEILSPLSDSAPISFDDLRQRLNRHPAALAPAILWLAKMGIIDLS